MFAPSVELYLVASGNVISPSDENIVDGPDDTIVVDKGFHEREFFDLVFVGLYFSYQLTHLIRTEAHENSGDGLRIGINGEYWLVLYVLCEIDE